MKKTIRVIDLLNKIANGEEVPKKIKKNWEYEYKYDGFRNEYHYMNHENKRFDEEWLIFSIINDEVEILDKEDEFIDINGYISGVGTVDEANIEEYIHILFEQQAKLIQNQKKIIERIKKEN